MSGPEDAQHPAASEEPTRIGKYEIVWLLGKGAMGAVYLAYDPFLERDVALKVMLPQIAHDAEHKRRFEREARAVARMMHPNVVTVFDLGYHTDGSPYIVMELLRGRDLHHALRKGLPLSLDTKVSIVLQVLEGLGHAHKVGIIHRDIKPANVFITEEGVAKIMDFGVARMAATLVTSDGVVVGTAAYMSPEQVAGGPLDGRSDLFSVGCMLSEMLTGVRPFEADSVMATLHRITHEEPALDLSGGPEAAALATILRRSLAKNAEERFGTAAEFATALRTFLREEATSPTMAAPPIVPAAVQAPPGEAGATIDLRAATAVPAPTVAVPHPRPDVARLFRLLRETYVGSKSGQLHFTHGQERRSLRIVKGQIVHGSCDVAGEHLGDVAVRFGLVTQADLDRAIAVVLRERKRLGVILPELAILDRDRLQEAVGLHVREILFTALDRPGGSFAFEELAESSLEVDLATKLSTAEVILEATRRVQDPELVGQALGDMNRILTLSSNPLLRAQKVTFTPTDGFVLSRIDGTLSAREVVSLVPLPPEDVERSLFGLLSTGTVDYVEAASRVQPSRGTGRRFSSAPEAPAPPPPPPAQAAASRPTPAAPPPLAPTAPLPPAPGPPAAPAPTPPSRAAHVEEVRRMLLETFDGLRQKDHFELLGIDRKAKESEIREAYARFARLLHPDACQDEALADLAAQRDAVFIRLGEAYETLRDPSSRGKYENSHPPRLRSRTVPAAGSSPPAAASPQPSPTPSPATEAEAPIARDPEREAAEALEAIRAAELLIKEQQYWDAILQLEPVIPRTQGPLRSRARVALARAHLKNPKWRHRAEEVLQLVVLESPDYAEAYVVLGNVYSEGELVGRATKMYRKALELRPGHPEAEAGLAALKAATEPSRTTGTLRNLLRKG